MDDVECGREHSEGRYAEAAANAILPRAGATDCARCHPGESLDDLKRRSSFSKEARGLLRDWMAVATARAVIARCR
jgi:hypothetical protein